MFNPKTIQHAVEASMKMSGEMQKTLLSALSSSSKSSGGGAASGTEAISASVAKAMQQMADQLTGLDGQLSADVRKHRASQEAEAGSGADASVTPFGREQ
jgi:formiminotetrahydrofolate cyclodeaminase